MSVLFLTFQDQQFAELRDSKVEGFKTMRDLWNLWKDIQTQETWMRVHKITAAFYDYAYEGGDMRPGIDKKQYELLMRSAAVPRKHRKVFDSFDADVWHKDAEGNISVDEFERRLVMHYKRILVHQLKQQEVQSKYLRGQQPAGSSSGREKRVGILGFFGK